VDLVRDDSGRAAVLLVGIPVGGAVSVHAGDTALWNATNSREARSSLLIPGAGLHGSNPRTGQSHSPSGGQCAQSMGQKYRQAIRRVGRPRQVDLTAT